MSRRRMKYRFSKEEIAQYENSRSPFQPDCVGAGAAMPEPMTDAEFEEFGRIIEATYNPLNTVHRLWVEVDRLRKLLAGQNEAIQSVAEDIATIVRHCE